jgi:pimeloyl-[acyl-carrier protein] methyl ester esterase
MPEALPLVLLHGWGMPSGIWSSVQRQLRGQRRTHAPDLPGYGEIPRVLPYSVDNIARRLAEAYPEPCIVCGWSMGGMVALTWADLLPEQVRGLVLVSTTPGFVLRPGWPHALDVKVFNEFAEQLRADHRTTLNRFISLQARGGGSARDVMAALRTELETQGGLSHETLTAGLDLLRHEDLRAAAMRVNCPTLLVHGGGDQVCPASAAGWLAATMLQARLALQPGAAHVPFLSHGDWFFEQLTQFMQELDE